MPDISQTLLNLVITQSGHPSLSIAMPAEYSITVQPMGGRGAIGPPGVNYYHEQLVSSATWTINHNLAYRPCVSIFSAGGKEVWAEILHVNDNQALVYFDSAFAGYAICS